jgi:hypothetical protein
MPQVNPQRNTNVFGEKEEKRNTSYRKQICGELKIVDGFVPSN